MDFTCLSVFSGVGMLDLGFSLAVEHIGGRARTVGYVERDAYAAACLLARMEDSSLEPAPIWSGSIEDLPREPYRGRVDCLVGGFPCQDISLAGSGGGIHGARSGLWFSMLDLACDLGCRWLAMENVAAITVRGLDAVLGSLAEVGFDAEWLCLPASEVGASHKRDRWFCLAQRAGGEVDNTRSHQRDSRNQPAVSESNRPVAHPGCRPVFAPGPNADWGRIVTDYPHLTPAIEPGLRVLVDGLALVVDPCRADQLRCCGNGVVPLQACVAFVELFQRIKPA